MAQAQIGSISHGTLRPQDLLRAFANEVERLYTPDVPDIVSDARKAANRLDEGNDTYIHSGYEIIKIIVSLESILEANAPDGCYFGTLEGDGSDFGFWPLNV